MRKLIRGIATLAAIAPIAAACSGGGSKPKIAGNATVHVVDSLGKPVAGIQLASSARGTVLAEGTTDAAGSATIGVAKGGEITTYKKIPSAYESRTVFDVVPGSTVVIPSGFYIGGPTNVTVTLTSTTDYSAATAVDAYEGGCGTPATIGMPATLDVTTLCLQTDGTWTLTAAAYGSAGILGYAIVPDLPLADPPSPTVLHGTNGGLVASVDAFVKGIPQPSQSGDTNQYDTQFYFTRKGQAFGNFFGATGSANYSGFNTPGARLVEPELADGLFEYLDITNQDGSYALARQTTNLASITVDATAMVAPPSSVTVVSGGRPGVTVVDPGPQGFDTFAGLVWSDTGSTTHSWFGWTAAPPNGGTRTISMPPVPADLAAFQPQSGATFTGTAGYYDEDDPPADFHSAPDAYVPFVRSGGFFHQYALKRTQ